MPTDHPESGYVYASSKRHPKEPDTRIISDDDAIHYHHVGEARIDGTLCHAWRWDGADRGGPNEDIKPARYVFQTRFGA